jgi:fused signal recognition particle receptor
MVMPEWFEPWWERLAPLREELEPVRLLVEAHPVEAGVAVGVPALVLVVGLVVRGVRRRRARALPEAEPGAAPEAAAPSEAPEPVAAAAPVAAPPEPEVEAPPARPVGLRERLARTQEAFVGRIEQLIAGRSVEGEVLDELEALLFSADLGVSTAESLLQAVRKEASGGDAARVREVLRETVATKLRAVEPPSESATPGGPPHVVLVLGVNGSGKTTTLGKLAARYREAGRSVILGAGDTFRAAALEQLQTWGERVGCEVVAGPPGGDPSAVAFDTLKAATARGIDVALIDTAGRLQTREPLIEELRKIVRVIDRGLPGAPHETLLVLDANTGQNAISQARIFTEAAPVTGLVLTKLDGTAKGGVLVGLADEFGIPVRYVGVGEGVEDLREFRADEFVEALFDEGGET